MSVKGRHERLRSIFLEVRDMSEADRAAALDRACGDDERLRAELDRLLARPGVAGIATGEGLARAAQVADDAGDETSAEGTRPPWMTASVPTRIGRYHLRSHIGAGGMATVYLAVQDKPRRRVAVKLMKPGITSRSALRRLEFESQILARLRHPNIAQVYEAGTHEQGGEGVPYFAMEYIPGARSLTDYARDRKLGTRERLMLVAQVCDAVHHGHQKGIIHRDLKPSNVLVDSSGQPKIIDFGVARATDSDMAVTTQQTDVGQLIGTLQYMSPEQCMGDPADVDVRSDVYALGIVLYELLCDRLPYDLSRVAIPEAARLIREATPERPSEISRALRGDIETIALKALEKDRERRYQSAADLGQDIDRYLADQPIDARPPTMAYQLRQFARRNRALITATLAIIVALVAGLAAATAGLMQARNERDAAEAARRESEAVVDFVSDMLAATGPSELEPDLRFRAVLDTAAASVATEFENRPLIQAQLRSAIGNTYIALGLVEPAEEHLAAAHAIREHTQGEAHPDTLSAANALAVLYRQQRRYDDAEALHAETLELRTRILGRDHPQTLDSMNNLAVVLKRLKRYSEAETLLQETLELRQRLLGAQHPDTLRTMNNLALLYDKQERYNDAEELHRQTLALRQEVLGELDLETLSSLNNLAVVCRKHEKYEEAETLYGQVIDRRRRSLGEEHVKTLSAMYNLALLYHHWGRLEDAEPWYRDTLRLRRRVLGVDDRATLSTMYNLAVLYRNLDRHAEAVPLYLEVADHGRWDDAVRDLEQAYGTVTQEHGVEDESAHVIARTLASLHEGRGRRAEAARWRARSPAEAAPD